MGSFYELIARTQKNLHQLCEDVSAKQSGAAGSPERMDEAAINAADMKPIQPQLDRITALKTFADVPATIAALQRALAE